MTKNVFVQMFVFGTNALEVFLDRLFEWSVYCRNILEISHLRDIHPELVVFIEEDLARNSANAPHNSTPRYIFHDS